MHEGGMSEVCTPVMRADLFGAEVYISYSFHTAFISFHELTLIPKISYHASILESALIHVGCAIAPV